MVISLSPVTIKAKILLQSLWLTGLDWDTEVPEYHTKNWINYRNKLSTIESIRIPRWLKLTGQEQSIQLHCFTDASVQAYAAVVYVKAVSANGVIFANMIASKTIVAPIKQLSLPRLELFGALLGAKLTQQVKTAMQFSEVEVFAWTKSTIVLAWLKGHPHKWKTFVANRVVKIHESKEAGSWGMYHLQKTRPNIRFEVYHRSTRTKKIFLCGGIDHLGYNFSNLHGEVKTRCQIPNWKKRKLSLWQLLP